MVSSHRDDSILQVDSLSVRYRKTVAVRDLSFKVRRGEITCLLGPNGAGKTSTLRALSRMTASKARGIRFAPGGRDAMDLRPLRSHQVVTAGVAHVPEGRQIFSEFSVRQNLVLGAYRNRDRHGQEALLDRVYEYFPVLHDRGRQSAGTLSGGEQQMLAIGRALMSAPELLFLDEPSFGLAPLIIEQIFDAIRRLADAGDLSVLLVEQNVSLALSISSYGYALGHGELLLEGSGDELLDNSLIQSSYLGVGGTSDVDS